MSTIIIIIILIIAVCALIVRDYYTVKNHNATKIRLITEVEELKKAQAHLGDQLQSSSNSILELCSQNADLKTTITGLQVAQALKEEQAGCNCEYEVGQDRWNRTRNCPKHGIN